MSQLPKEFRVLLLDDDPRDAELVSRAIETYNPEWVLHRVDSRSAFTDALQSFAPDVILSDHSLGDFAASEALHLAQAGRPGCPFILVSGAFPGHAAECLKAGAADFVGKMELNRLGPAIDNALDMRVPLRKLSTRQLQVLQLLASGSSTRDIAEELGVSVKTVETHRSQLMKRLGIRHLAGLVRFAIRMGLVSAGQ
jgi:DNA-binding NarL/FixJ family response regulator